MRNIATDNDQLRRRERQLEEEIRYLREYSKKLISTNHDNNDKFKTTTKIVSAKEHARVLEEKHILEQQIKEYKQTVYN